MSSRLVRTVILVCIAALLGLSQTALAARVVEADLPYAEGGPASENPCPADGVCRYLDAESGNDNGPGTIDQPWRTLAKAKQEVESGALPPGTHILLRRGRTWQESVQFNNVHGLEGRRYVIGAYGPLDEPKPRVAGEGGVGVRYSSYWMVRDLDVAGITFYVNRHGIIFNNDVRGWGSNGIRLHGGVHYSAVVGNVIYDGDSNDAISMRDTAGRPTPEEVWLGSHHWIVDNIIIGNSGVQELIDVGAEGWRNGQEHPQDVKIINNLLQSMAVPPSTRSGAANSPLRVVLSWKYVWVVGNIGANGAREGFFFGTGDTTQREYLRLSSNVIFGNAGAPVVSGGLNHWFTHNTLFGELRIQTNQTNLDTSTNLVLSGAPFARGLRLPENTPYNNDPLNWRNPDFLAHFIPEATDEAVVPGAFAPDSTRQGFVVEPFEGYENNGYGWEGPLLIQARYPLPEASGE